MGNIVSEVLVNCDAIECGYRIVELTNGRFAFVWGNIRARVGSELPKRDDDENTAEEGIEYCDTYEEAESQYRDCAEALRQYGEHPSALADEMLARL